MTQPYDPRDPRYFTTYSTKPYDRHEYIIKSKNGEKLKVESYDNVKAIWYECRDELESVEIVDVTRGKGF